MVQRLALLGLVTILSASSASALVITGSGTSLPAGLGASGSCSWGAGSPGETGTTLSCTIASFGSLSAVYIGIDTGSVNGLKMDGSAPAASSVNVFRSSTTAASSITYTSSTSITSLRGLGSGSVSNTLVLTRTLGSGTVVPTGGNPANSAANGDIGHLFRVTATGSFNISAAATSSGIALSGASCDAVYDPANASAGAGNCQSRVAIKFYWSQCGDGLSDPVNEVCDDGVNNGTPGSCCTTSCTFKSAGTQCTDSSPTNCKDAQCTGVANVCDQNFGNEAFGASCAGNGTGECSGADSCDGAGTCSNNDVAAGTPCTDSSPPSSGNCKDAQCNGTGTCDQNFANEADATPCDNGFFCDGTETCTSGSCGGSTGDPCPGPDGDGNCAESCDEALNNCTANDPAASPCNDSLFCNGTDTCNLGLCNVHTGDPCPGPDGDGDCQESCNEAGDDCTADDPNSSPCSDGLFCDGTETCTSGSCGSSTGDPCPGPDGDVNCSESCDEGADNCLAADTDGTLCRADAGECDVEETCLSGSCPADSFEPASTPCGDPSDTECTNPDTCDGSGSCLVNDELSGTPCGDPSDTACTDPDTCDGAGSCQDNHEPGPGTVVCRAATAGGDCDEVEYCDGAGSCPADGVKTNGTVCRPDTGECDVEETCDGASYFCPSDSFEPALTACGSPADTDCDNPDTCDGNNNCLDNLETNGTPCGDPSDTECTNPDTCDGAGTCEVNDETNGTPCGDPSDTDCTNPDTCDGSGSCQDNHEAAATPCGSPLDDDCTNPDTCDGGGTCESNDEADGTACGDPSDTDCSNPDTCLGGACNGNHEPNTVLCRAATSGADCNEPENCDGAGNCPADAVYPNGTVCRAATTGALCDEPEVCDGVSVFCPADDVYPNGHVCRPDAGDCDVEETCDGSSDQCPPDGFEPAATPCGSPSDTNCDNPDTCDGSGMCLVNNEPDATPCDDSNACTGDDECTAGVCQGPTDLCPDLDHYKCYQGKDLKSPKFLQLTGVNLTDQINTEAVEVKKLKYVCSPVDKNGEGINAPSAHLACYQIKALKFPDPRPKVEVDTQFQTSQFSLKKGKLVCRPATKSIIP